MSDNPTSLAELFFGARQQDATPEQLRKAKTEIGALMAEAVVAKVATGLIAKSAERIKASTEGDKSLSTQLDLLAADCKSKLQRICEGRDANPADTRFAHYRGQILQELDQLHEAAQSIADLTASLSKALSLPEEAPGD